MTLGSLFSGIGGFELAASRCDITPIWASEIISECISITKRHFPDIKHLGDITKINGTEVEPVDIITGGSPCQNLSQAGNRKGLIGSESSLFYEMIRVIGEMRKSTKRQFPKYVVWENVEGAFSSNNGEDFRTVLQEFLEVCDVEKSVQFSVPRPSEGRWLPSGTILGDGWSIAWRCMDAQYWGVPQRRNRIFLVVDFRGRNAPEVLYKPESEGWYSTACGKSREDTSLDVKESSCSRNLAIFENHGTEIRKELTTVFPTVKRRWGTGGNNVPLVQTIKESQDQVIGLDAELNSYEDKMGVIKSQNTNNIVCLVSSSVNAEITQNDISPTLMARAGQGGNQLPMVAIPINDRATRHKSKSSNGLGIGKEGDPFPTLDSSSHHSVAYCIQGNTIGRSDNAGAEGKGVNEDVSFTLTGADRHAVAYQQTIGTLCKDDAKGINSQYVNQDKCIVTNNFAIRRLTPRETERLQGFSDDWTRWGHDGKEISDSKRYQAIGNSVAIPCVHRVLWGIKEICLFD